MADRIRIETSAHEGMDCLIALPHKHNGAAVVLSMSVWGLNEDLTAIVNYYAALGYAVIAPNLFWRLGGPHAVEYDFGKLADIKLKMDASSDEVGALDLIAARDHLASRIGFNRVGLIGWCYGGRIACMFSSQTEFDAVIGVYPTNLETCLELAEGMRTPTQIHLAELEQFASVEDAVDRIVETYRPLSLADCHVYPGVQHGFDFGPPHIAFNHPAARLCDTRSALYFEHKLLRHGA